MPLDLRSLRYVVAVARRLSFVRAAEDLGLSQPALTRAIQGVESRLGTLLFYRERGGQITVTANGELLITRAEALLAEADDIERTLIEAGRGAAGRISFGMAPMPARALLSGLLQPIIAEMPGLTVSALVRTAEGLWPLLLNGTVEFFVAAEGQLPDDANVRCEMIGSFPIDFVVRRGHPFLHGGAGGCFPLLLGSHARPTLIDDLPFSVCGTPQVVEDLATLAALTIESDAVWISSRFAVRHELSSGDLAILPAQANSVRMMIYSLAARPSSPAMQLLRKRVDRLMRYLVAEPANTTER